MLLIQLKFGLYELLLLLRLFLSGTGVFMKKFSFGDEERIRTGKKVIRGALFSYSFILAIDLILSAIQLLMSSNKEI